MLSHFSSEIEPSLILMLLFSPLWTHTETNYSRLQRQPTYLFSTVACMNDESMNDNCAVELLLSRGSHF